LYCLTSETALAPETREEIQKEIQGLQEVIQKEEAVTHKKKEELCRKQFVLEILSKLSTPRPDPGKYGPAYLCISSGGKRAIPLELLTKEQVESVQDVGYSVLPWIKMRKRECPLCKEEHPLILRHYQTYDSPEGDEWELQKMVICPQSQRAYMVAEPRTGSNRLI
jgi:uncharacterized protein YbaR (Trm112 family)